MKGTSLVPGDPSLAHGHVGTHKRISHLQRLRHVTLCSWGRHLRDESTVRAKPIASETRLEGNVWSRGLWTREGLLKLTATASASSGPAPAPVDPHAPVCEATAPPGRGAAPSARPGFWTVAFRGRRPQTVDGGPPVAPRPAGPAPAPRRGQGWLCQCTWEPTTVGRGDTRQGSWLPAGLEGFQAPDSSPYSRERKRVSQAAKKATRGRPNAPGIRLDFGRAGGQRRREKAACPAAAGQRFGYQCSSVPDEGAWPAGASEGGRRLVSTPPPRVSCCLCSSTTEPKR